MKKLLIAEKPSLARAFMRALSSIGEKFNSHEEDEYYESNNYVVTCQFGHMVELYHPEDYDYGPKGWEGWKVENLPFFPKKYQYFIIKDCKKRFATIKKLLNRSDIDCIYNCGDPAREGQILVDLVLKEAGNTKPVKRPWWDSVESDTELLRSIRESKNNEEYVLLRNEGLARSFYDFDMGINLSRFLTGITHASPALNVGRVKGAICKEIYDRDMAIKNFVQEIFYKVESNVDGLKLTSKQKFDKNSLQQATDYANKLQAETTTVTNVEKKPVTKKAPSLFSQTSIQGFMNDRFLYTPDQTLSLCQGLYEKGLTTYPRTNTSYLSENDAPKIKDILSKIDTTGELIFKHNKSIFDNSKVEDHSALIITGKSIRGISLSEAEKNCYMAILNRFRAVFCKEECLYDKTIISIHNPIEDFTVTGETLKQLGWQKFEPAKKEKVKEGAKEDDENENTSLPAVTVGQVLNTNFGVVEGKTKPPAHYTVAALGKWMENPFKKEDAENDDEDYKNILAGLEIGTTATRSKCLDVLCKKGYISLKKKSYYIEERGIFLVEAATEAGIDFSKDKTAEMSRLLKGIRKGETKVVDFLAMERKEIEDIIKNGKTTRMDTSSSGNSVVGKCPICGRDVFENRVGFGCSGYKEKACEFFISKEPFNCKKKISAKDASDLLKKGYTNKLNGFKSKKSNYKNSFSARLRLEKDGKLSFDFDD